MDTAEAARIVAWRKTTEEGAKGDEGKGSAKLGASQPPPQQLTAAVLRLHAQPLAVRPTAAVLANVQYVMCKRC